MAILLPAGRNMNYNDSQSFLLGETRLVRDFRAWIQPQISGLP
jgi:hypothetical protein